MASNPQHATQPQIGTSIKGRNLVLCFDGTDNEFSETNTNVVKLFSFLEKESPEQLCYYQTGVGTYEGSGLNPVNKWIAKVVDLGVAAFLDEHVRGGYRFLQSTYRPGDRIYLFGFSRGAYTARALAGMLYTVGLLPRSMPEQVPFAYNIFVKGKESTAYKRAFSRSVTIEFLGVFDTVASVGAIFPRILPFSSDNHITKTFRHAMSLDEHRAKFRSNPWHLTVDPEVEDPFDGPHAGIFRTGLEHLLHHREEAHQHEHHRSETIDERIETNKDRKELDHDEGLDLRPPTSVKEVWFSGCHCDVGGGNAPDSAPHALANIPLKWMLKEIIASETGLIFRRAALDRAHINLDELIEAAARTKIADAKEAARKYSAGSTAPTSPTDGTAPNSPITGTSTFLGGATLTANPRNIADDVQLEPPPKDGGPAVNAAAGAEKQIDEKVFAQAQEDLYTRWKASSGARDAMCKLTDELQVAPAWWPLEFLPFLDSNQDPHGRWKDRLYVNLFRPRDIPRPPAHSNPNSAHNKSTLGVSISDAPALFHISVRQRMESEECASTRWTSLWRKKIPYRPKAWPKTGDPVWVE